MITSISLGGRHISGTDPRVQTGHRAVAQPLDQIATKLALLTTMIERLISEISGLRVELAAQRERWESGNEEEFLDTLDKLRNRLSPKNL